MEQDAIEAVIGWLKGSSKNVILTGAELSMESGLPDFGDESFNPPIAEFWESEDARIAYWGKMSDVYPVLSTAKPNAAHEAIAEMGMLGFLETLFTQATDGLHLQFDSLPAIELNCSINWVDCNDCGMNYSLESVIAQLDKGVSAPVCEVCGSNRIKPPISFPGQPVPHWELREAWMKLHNCEVLLAVGANLDRQPVSALPSVAKGEGSKIVIISERESPADDFADAVIYGKPSIVLPYLLKRLKEDIEFS